jgi:hypothetical protein
LFVSINFADGGKDNTSELKYLSTLLNRQTRSSWNSDRLSTPRMEDKYSYIFGFVGAEGDILPAQFI